MKLRDRFKFWVTADVRGSLYEWVASTDRKLYSVTRDHDDFRTQMETAANFTTHTTAQLEALTRKFQEVADKLELPAQSMTLLFNWVSDLRKRVENLEKSSVRLASHLPKAAKRTAKAK